MSARPSLQLFPTERPSLEGGPPKRHSIEKSVRRQNSNGKVQKPAVIPKITVERSKSPNDFHELITTIKVDSHPKRPKIAVTTGSDKPSKPPKQIMPPSDITQRSKSGSPLRYDDPRSDSPMSTYLLQMSSPVEAAEIQAICQPKKTTNGSMKPSTAINSDVVSPIERPSGPTNAVISPTSASAPTAPSPIYRSPSRSNGSISRPTRRGNSPRPGLERKHTSPIYPIYPPNHSHPPREESLTYAGPLPNRNGKSPVYQLQNVHSIDSPQRSNSLRDRISPAYSAPALRHAASQEGFSPVHKRTTDICQQAISPLSNDPLSPGVGPSTRIFPPSNRKVVLQSQPQEHIGPVQSSSANVTARAASPASNHPYMSPISAPLRHASPVKSPERARVASPAFSEGQTTLSGSPTLVRNNSARSPPSPEEIPMQSMFPRYNPDVPLTQQAYLPARLPPIQIPMTKVSKFVTSPEHLRSPASPKPTEYFTPAAHLGGLWEAANGQMVPSGLRNYALKIHQPEPKTFKFTDKEAPKVSFGPSNAQPFYSIRQSDSIPPQNSAYETAPRNHELLIFRHRPSRPDILPTVHMHITPPPPPSLYTTPRPPQPQSFAQRPASPSSSYTAEPATHITTITPTLAALAAISQSAHSPLASHLARIDPAAKSPAAARLAEQAVQHATQRESSYVYWQRTSPKTGRYFIQHPDLGVFEVGVEGEVGAGFDRPASSGVKPSSAKLTVVNPYTATTVVAPRLQGEIARNGEKRLWDEDANAPLVCLDLEAGRLDLDVAGIQSLGNAYLVDVLVSAVVAVVVAEAGRGEDPGLVFEGPPSSEAWRVKEEKRNKKAMREDRRKSERSSRSRGGSMGVRECGDLEQGQRRQRKDEELPKVVRGVLGLLGLGVRVVVWIVEMGIKVLGKVVLGLGRAIAGKK